MIVITTIIIAFVLSCNNLHRPPQSMYVPRRIKDNDRLFGMTHVLLVMREMATLNIIKVCSIYK